MKKKNVESVGMRNSRADTKARRVSGELSRSKTHKGTTAEKAGQELGTSPEREREREKEREGGHSATENVRLSSV